MDKSPFQLIEKGLEPLLAAVGFGIGRNLVVKVGSEAVPVWFGIIGWLTVMP